MAGVTEIYVCKPGQGLKEGTLETSTRIDSREEAESDAEQRCKLDPSIERIAYYAVDESGTFRNFLTYKNPRPPKAAKPVVRNSSAARSTARPASVPVRRPGRSPSLLQRLRMAFEED